MIIFRTGTGRFKNTFCACALLTQKRIINKQRRNGDIFMPRGKRNPVPAEVENAAVEQEAAKVETKEVAAEPKRRPGRPPKNAAKVVVEEQTAVEEEVPRVTRKRASRTVKKNVEKVEKPGKIVEETKKVSSVRAAKTVDSAVIIQFEGKNIETKNVAETAKERWIAAGNKESVLKSIEVYINVTEGMAYPVINGEAQEGFSCC